MNKIKSLLKGSPLAMIVAGVLIAGVASAALLTVYGHMNGTADVKQSVLFGDDDTTEKTYEVGNSAPVAGNVYYDLVTLKNNASDKVAPVSLSTEYWYGGHHGFTSDPEPGITTSYMKWDTPQFALAGTRPTAVYNPYDGTGYQNYKKYEVWYKTDENAAKIHYAYYHYQSGSWRWDGGDTDVDGGYDAPFVTKEDGKYYMVNYGGTLTGGAGSDPTDVKSFYIYTSSDGTSWTKGPQIYTEKHANFAKVDNPKIIKDETGYKMYFQGKVSASPQKYYIFLATSDAKNLKEIAGGTKTFAAANGGSSVLQPGAEGEWDSFRVMQPMVFKSGNKGYTMLYTGYDQYDQTAKIGYAVSDDGISWTKVKVSKEGYDTNLGTKALKTSVVKTDNNLVLFYLDESGTHDVINWTRLTNVNNPMTLQPQEVKPFFIKNDFMINLAPGDYKIKTSVNPE